MPSSFSVTVAPMLARLSRHEMSLTNSTAAQWFAGASVAASWAALGDILIAEPQALIGFAGPRTIKLTLGIDLPEGFQSSEFLLEHGFVDMIVNRVDMKKELSKLLSLVTSGLRK